jgi:hypothetical protein
MTRWNHAVHDAIRARLGLRARRRIAFARLALRRRIPLGRVLPGALVIGTQRGGTSSLYTYLVRHPDTAPSLRKEIGYFTHAYREGPDWYRAHFPPAARDALRRRAGRRPRLAFEATPDYLLDPRAAARAATLLPEARIIALLRDPVERARSHWKHMRRLGLESLPFPEAIAAERERLGEHLARLAAVDPLDASIDEPLPRSVARFSYLARGRYADQLGRWLERFPPERVLIVRSEDFFADPPASFASILAFLGLDPWRPSEFRNVSRRDVEVHADRSRASLEPALRARLEAEFAGDNERLYRLIGRDLGWGGTAG